MTKSKAEVAASFDGGGACVAPPDVLARIRNLIVELGEAEDAVEMMEENLKTAKKRLQQLRTVTMPDALAEIQSDHFTYMGYEVRISDFVSGNLPKEGDKREAAIKWLEEHDGGSLLKTDVHVEFPKSQHEEAMTMAKTLIEHGYAPNVNVGVHPNSLQAYARERIKNGEPIDFDVLGLYTGRVAKVKKTSKAGQ
jgi:hypothetical protein